MVRSATSVHDGHLGVSFFVCLYPNVMISSTNSAYNLTVSNSAAAHYALTVMTVVAVLFPPLVLLYQGWSYHVFRARVGSEPQPASAPDRQRPRPRRGHNEAPSILTK